MRNPNADGSLNTLKKDYCYVFMGKVSAQVSLFRFSYALAQRLIFLVRSFSLLKLKSANRWLQMSSDLVTFCQSRPRSGIIRRRGFEPG